MTASNSKQGVNLLWVGILVEGGLACLALTLAWMGIFDQKQSLIKLNQVNLLHALAWGFVALIPMLGYLALFHFWRPSFYQPMHQTVDERLRPMFSSSTYLELLLISIMAGLGEELFFRWCIQGGISSWLEPTLGIPVAIGIGLMIASLFFGICHWVNVTYAVVTFFAGAFLGMVMVWSGTWLASAFAHAAFDFVALLYIVNSKPRTRATELS
jgi:membrane protease YdiL (CAAX protease family)